MTGRVGRFFYRCPECVSIFAVESENEIAGLLCSVCNVTTESMGRVEGTRLVFDGEACPCDARCTSARGPKCDCFCKGENHGTNLLVAVTRDAGPVPTVTPIDPEAARKRAKEFRAVAVMVRAAIDEKFGEILGAKRSGAYLTGRSYAGWSEGVEFLRALGKARSMKTHPGRMKKAAEIRIQVSEASVPVIEARS